MFAPRREHARFCSPRCRVAWNRQRDTQKPVAASLDWSVTAMCETTDRLLKADGWDLAHSFAVITEAVWWVTMVDATLVRYHPDSYAAALATHDAVARKTIEDTFGGLRFVRNRMGYEADQEAFIRPRLNPSGLADGRVAVWTWRAVRKPALATLPQRGQDWELSRFRAYRAQLAGHSIEDTFGRAASFLRAANGASVSHA